MTFQRKRRPGQGGVISLENPKNYAEITEKMPIRHHYSAPADWLIARHHVRPVLAARVAELAGLGSAR